MAEVHEKVQQYKKYLDRYADKEFDEKKILHVIKKLDSLAVTLDHLQSTGIGKTVNLFRKHDGLVSEKSRELVAKWKGLVPALRGASKPGIQCETISETHYDHSNKSQSLMENSPPKIRAPYLSSNGLGAPSISPTAVRVKEEYVDDVTADSKPVKFEADDFDKSAFKTKMDNFAKTFEPKVKTERNERNVKGKGDDSERESKRDDKKIRVKEEEIERERKRDDKKYRVKEEEFERERKRDDKKYRVKEEEIERERKRDDKKYKVKEEEFERESKRDDKKGREREHEKKRSSRESSSESKGHESKKGGSPGKTDQGHKVRENGPRDRERSSEKSSDHRVNSESLHSSRDRDSKREGGESTAKSSRGDKHKSSSHKEREKHSKYKDSGLKKSSSERDSTRERDKSYYKSVDDSPKPKRLKETCGRDGNLSSGEDGFDDEIPGCSHEMPMDAFSLHKVVDHPEEFSLSGDEAPGEPARTKRDEAVKKTENSGSKEVVEEDDGMSFEDLLSYDAQLMKKRKKKCAQSQAAKLSSEKSKTDSHSSKKDRSDHRDKSSHVSSNHRHESKKETSSADDRPSSSKDKRHTSSNGQSSGSKSRSSHSHSSDGKSRSSQSHSSGGKSKSHHQSSDGSSKLGHSHSADGKSRSGQSHSLSKSDQGASDTSTKERSPPTFAVPAPSKKMKLSEGDILSSLPDPSPNYHPLPYLAPTDGGPSHKQEEELDESLIGARVYSKVQLYSGKKTSYLTAVPKLYDSCIRVLSDNLDALDYVGGVPYDILKPVLQKCSPVQLYNLEDVNTHFVGDTDELWQAHCKKDFRKDEPDEFESWRELYLRKHDEREAKLKKLTQSIKGSMKQATPVRQTKLAYVDVSAKPPRGVRRAQERHGTAGPSKTDPLARLTSHGSAPKPPRAPIPRAPSSAPEPRAPREKEKVKSVAPMMAKTMRMMKNLRR